MVYVKNTSICVKHFRIFSGKTTHAKSTQSQARWALDRSHMDPLSLDGFIIFFFVIAFHFENTANKGEGHKVTPGLALSHPFHNRQDVHHISINNIVPRESKSLQNHSDT